MNVLSAYHNLHDRLNTWKAVDEEEPDSLDEFLNFRLEMMLMRMSQGVMMLQQNLIVMRKIQLLCKQ